MGNSSTKESRSASVPQNQISDDAHPTNSSAVLRQQSSVRSDRHIASTSNRSRNGRHEIPFLNLGVENTSFTPRRETKQEREARKLEKERVARLKERERSLKEESVDGGYLVTLGTYVGPEDFNKPVVRQLMIERRLAPFWRGLNEHSESLTEHQLVAAAQGLPIPAPDEIPFGEQTDVIVDSDKMFTQPISFQIQSSGRGADEGSPNLSKSHPTTINTEASPHLFRGRSKTLASLASSRTELADELDFQEVHLPKNPFINGQRIEATLYKDVQECPICFLYYPLYLNRTRCCDQPICSECFVQIKRPNPHVPEHTDPSSPPPDESQRLIAEDQLISEPATCPFCVQPELGVTYQPPQFRRGLIYQGQVAPSGREYSILQSKVIPSQQDSDNTTNAAAFQGSRRRGQSLSSSDPAVITTDRVRPDWFKKLSDARSHAARRSAAATALHSAAYMMGSSERNGFGRRRRHIIRDTPSSSSDGTPRVNDAISIPNFEALLAALEGQGSVRSGSRVTSDLIARTGARSNHVEDLEEVMMMEAIRQSLAVEEERKKRADKEAKKEEKKAAKEQKKADRTARKSSYSSNTSANVSNIFDSADVSLPSAGDDEEMSKEKATGLAEPSHEEVVRGAKVNPLREPTSTVNTELSTGEATHRHLEKSKASEVQTDLDSGQARVQKAFTTALKIESQSHSPTSMARSSSAIDGSSDVDGTKIAGSP